MRLLQRDQAGKISLTRDLVGDDPIPPYAILSHTWGLDEDEVTLRDMMSGTAKKKLGWQKIRLCVEQAWLDGLRYCWVDTCAIDKSNSVELQEAINSMFRWYQNAEKCYVYLIDVLSPRHTPISAAPWEQAFSQSRWFTRGWTLQELIAPEAVEFYAQDWTCLGTKATLETTISHRTGISIEVLRGRPLANCSVEERMAWGQSRMTKREEDRVYSLLGIFDVTMPLVYGEGKARAFRRLHEEIIKHGTLTALG